MKTTKESNDHQISMDDERVLAPHTDLEDYEDDYAEEECWGTTRMPSDEDYLNGDADILTGDWM